METIYRKGYPNSINLQNFNNEQMVQAVLNWSEEQYCYFKYDYGLEYAEQITNDDIIGFDTLIKTRFFWQWWKNEWSKRDADFLHYYSNAAHIATLYDQYLFQHSIQRLKSDDLMERKACSMIGHCIDEHHKTQRKGLIK